MNGYKNEFYSRMTEGEKEVYDLSIDYGLVDDIGLVTGKGGERREETMEECHGRNETSSGRHTESS